MEYARMARYRHRLASTAVACTVLAVSAFSGGVVHAAPVEVTGRGALSVARNADGRLELFGKDGADQIFHRWQSAAGAASWTSWSAMDGSLRSVAAEANADGRVELFGLNAQGQVWHRWQKAGGGWSDWAALDGTMTPAPPAPPAPPMSDPSTWALTHTVAYSNEDWTEEAQGVTTDGTNWYVGSNNADSRRVYKFGPNFPRGDARVLDVLSLPANAGSHLGPPIWDPVRRRIVVAVEPSNVWVIDSTTMRTEYLGPLGGDGPKPQGNSIPWVAVNPVDGLLYSSVFGRDDLPIKEVNRIHVYDPNNHYRWVRTIMLDKTLKEVQGGHISSGGHLYVTSNTGFDISAFDLANGAYGGRQRVLVDWSSDDEIEGVTLGRYEWAADDVTNAAVLVLDNDWPDEDDVTIKFYRTDSDM